MAAGEQSSARCKDREIPSAGLREGMVVVENIEAAILGRALKPFVFALAKQKPSIVEASGLDSSPDHQR
jgi:hypothetical protein